MHYFIGLMAIFFLGACGEQEKTKGIPGSEKPTLNSFQRDKTSSIAGAMGDIVNYIAVKEGNRSVAMERLEFSRRPMREKLNKSIDVSLCKIKKNKINNIKMYSLSGSDCSVRIKTEREERQSGDTDGDYFQRKNFRLDFVANNHFVVTDLDDLTMRGSETTRINYESNEYILQRSMEASAEVVSKTMGNFSYKVVTDLERKVDFGTKSKNSEVYVRTDTLNFSGFTAVIHHKSVLEAFKAKEDEYYLNGVKMGSQEYKHLLQDLDAQMGLKEIDQDIERF